MYKGVNELRNYTCRDKGFTEKFINIQRCVKFAKKKKRNFVGFKRKLVIHKNKSKICKLIKRN